ncbi:hypothetical protein EVAR_14566_1 [Eumeta japonica]|uniref:Uncharacterized protein n=1 Tax=Eumeta variegata TaxID=151549 RepID=A0A4C1UUS4_EUMVA|nr:hypothetical protein EVAR_14566_1 [Eumeta japonica]
MWPLGESRVKRVQEVLPPLHISLPPALSQALNARYTAPAHSEALYNGIASLFIRLWESRENRASRGEFHPFWAPPSPPAGPAEGGGCRHLRR